MILKNWKFSAFLAPLAWTTIILHSRCLCDFFCAHRIASEKKHCLSRFMSQLKFVDEFHHINEKKCKQKFVNDTKCHVAFKNIAVIRMLLALSHHISLNLYALNCLLATSTVNRESDYNFLTRVNHLCCLGIYDFLIRLVQRCAFTLTYNQHHWLSRQFW